MSLFMTQASSIHSPSRIPERNSIANSKHKHGECRRREQNRIGILIQLIQWSCISFVFISPTWYVHSHSISFYNNYTYLRLFSARLYVEYQTFSLQSSCWRVIMFRSLKCESPGLLADLWRLLKEKYMNCFWTGR